MRKQFKLKIVLFIINGFLTFICFGQNNIKVTLTQKNVDCTKGAAGIVIDSLKTSDTTSIVWSNGQTAVNSIAPLDEGNYSVHVTVKNKIDTTLNFSISTVVCPVIISNHFTPNGDNYNDTWQISNINNYPNFELCVYNKWGQLVFNEKDNYTPWNGKWLGIDVADGTYYYVFFFDKGNKKELLKGDVTILR
ncbi:MAG: gliding motility-associated C-terminal domain-containing protein [Bacteroidetes bacterium]|nr:gliding motility-associated C-terminal domain-containing protein [Bacteroidota bacterium]